MKTWDYIFFDLDGTLTDPKEGITKSAAYALAAFGVVEELDDLCKFIGPPLRDSFVEFYGFSKEQADEGLRKFRERFETVGWKENIPYPGIKELLVALKDSGKHLMVATSKPETMAMRILQYFDLDGYFDLIAGADMEEIRVKKEDVLRYAIERLEHFDAKHAVMVGDRMHDVAGAKEIGLDTVGVLYGYGNREELTNAGADEIVGSVKELEQLLTR